MTIATNYFCSTCGKLKQDGDPSWNCGIGHINQGLGEVGTSFWLWDEIQARGTNRHYCSPDCTLVAMRQWMSVKAEIVKELVGGMAVERDPGEKPPPNKLPN